MANEEYPSEDFREIHFPKAGLDLSQAFMRQPARQVYGGQYARTCALGQNVRGWEPVTGRSRGGSRPGLSKYIPKQTSGSNLIQELTTLTYEGTHGPGGEPVQTSQSGRVVVLVAVTQGNVYGAIPGDTSWTLATNNSSSTPPLNATGLCYSAPNNQLLYLVDGTNYRVYDPSQNAVNTWTATAGALPVDDVGNTARLIATWRGRTVLSGLIGNPNGWFMSAVSTPTDFNYGPLSTSPSQAVAGSNSPLGLIGDVVTNIIPYTDDTLIWGGDSSIWMMRGDPMAGGQIDLVSDAIGMAWGKAWTRDPLGNLYFFSNRTGIYQYTPGNQPIRISQQIEQLLQIVDTGANTVRMVWNDRFQGLHVFVSPTAAAVTTQPSTATHFFWEQRSGAWWTDFFFSGNLDPLCCVTFDGNSPTDRVALIGSWDGYVRAIDPTATTDDGFNIASRVLIGPFDTEDFDDVVYKDHQGILAETSGQVNARVLSGTTPEAALSASSASPSIVWSSGRNFTSPVRRSAHAHYIDLSSTTQWAMESVRARVATLGKVRRRGK